MKKVMFLSILFFSFFVSAEDVTCENEAGNCTLSEDEYSCNCNTLDGLGIAHGDVSEEEVTAELCKSYLESNCGKEKPTVRSKCGKKFDLCVTYVSERSRCSDNYMTEEEVITAVDSEDFWNDTKEAVYRGCCGAYSASQSKLECLHEKCGEEFTDECCAECHITDTADTGADTGDTGETDIADTADTGNTGDTDTADTADTSDTGDTGDVSPDTENDTANTDADDTANTEVPTDGATPEDTADGNSAPATDSKAPAENKEKSKSDGCSVLFV